MWQLYTVYSSANDFNVKGLHWCLYEQISPAKCGMKRDPHCSNESRRPIFQPLTAYGDVFICVKYCRKGRLLRYKWIHTFLYLMLSIYSWRPLLIQMELFLCQVIRVLKLNLLRRPSPKHNCYRDSNIFLYMCTCNLSTFCRSWT